MNSAQKTTVLVGEDGELYIMAVMQRNPFVTGGPVRFDSDVYITRKIETKIFESITQKRYITLIGSRQVGKTSLLQRIQATVERQYGHSSALIDLSTINYPGITWETWAQEFCKRIIWQLANFRSQEPAPPPPQTSQAFIDYLVALGPQIHSSTILILLDEANALPVEIGDAFYSNIRWLYTDRTSYRPIAGLAKYNFAFAGVFEPDRLVQARENSPFNVSEIFYLPDFTQQEVMQLLQPIFSGDLSSVANAIYAWSAGHPYLTQRIAALLSAQVLGHEGVMPNTDMVAHVIPQLIETASDNISHVVRLALETEQLRKIVEKIIAGEKLRFNRVRRAIAQLELFGAIKEGEQGDCQIRNRIYDMAIRQALGLYDESSTTQSSMSIGSSRQLALRTLRDALVILYPNETSARRIVEDAGLPLVSIDFDSNAVNLWYGILSEAQKHTAGVKQLIETVQREYPDNVLLKNACQLYFGG